MRFILAFNSVSMQYSSMGRLATGSSGLGILSVSGANLVPAPPAKITAFIAISIVSLMEIM